MRKLLFSTVLIIICMLVSKILLTFEVVKRLLILPLLLTLSALDLIEVEDLLDGSLSHLTIKVLTFHSRLQLFLSHLDRVCGPEIRVVADPVDNF